MLLCAAGDIEILPGLFYLRNGRTMNLGESGDVVRVGGLGGCYGPSDFERQSKHLQGYAKRHYTRDEIEVLGSVSMVDIVLVHDAPAGIRFTTPRRGGDWVSEAAGLDLLIFRLRPLVCFFGHHHVRLDGEVAGIHCIGLNRVHMPGNLVAVDVDRRQRQWTILGEWPARGAHEEDAAPDSARRASARAVGQAQQDRRSTPARAQGLQPSQMGGAEESHNLLISH